MQKLLRPAEVADVLAIGRTKTYQLLRKNELPGVVRIGKSVRVSAEALERWVRERASESVSR